MSMRLLSRAAFFLTFAVAAMAGSGCESNISGTPFDNQPPDTQLSVRDTSLVDNLGEEDRLSSSVQVSWSGTDSDGFVEAYELRYYADGERPAAEAGWTRTMRSDSLVLLPIPRGERGANVVFEVRAVDNDGAVDPDPARTVFPIRNSPPTIRLSAFDLPPDTTFTVFTVGYEAKDPEGAANISRIEVALNDSTSFTSLPADIDFVAFLAQLDENNPAQTTADARVYIGRGFQSTGITVPGLKLDSENTLYLRAVDQTDTTSALASYSWYVRKPAGDILFVNDFRTPRAPLIGARHMELLQSYLPVGETVDVWDLSRPSLTGSVSNFVRSDALPQNADPTLRQTLALYKHIYWVSSGSTAGVQGYNLPFAASVMDLFFERGGSIMVHTPVSLPNDPEANLGNAAILLLPLSDLITLPSGTTLRVNVGRDLTSLEPVPGTGEQFPQLEPALPIFRELPYEAEGTTIVPLLSAPFQPTSGGEWTGPTVVASMSADQRVGLFALPMYNEITGGYILRGTDGDPQASVRAIHLMLRGLGFPSR